MDANKDPRQISPIRTRGNDIHVEDQAFDQVMQYTGAGRSEIEKSKRSHTPESNYRQYIPYGPYDEEYHQHNNKPENWYGEMGEGRARFIPDNLVMFSLPTDEIRDRLKAEAFKKANTRSTDNEYIGVPMIFNSTADINFPVQTHDPYYVSKDVPHGQHQDKNRRDYVPAKRKVDPSVVVPPHVSNRGTTNSARRPEGYKFSPMTDTIDAGQIPISDKRFIYKAGHNRKRKAKPYSVNESNKKRGYQWKDGKAPVRRLGHVNYPEGHEFHNMPKRGTYVVEKQEEDKDQEEEDGNGFMDFDEYE